jgi:hypothetical protein
MCRRNEFDSGERSFEIVDHAPLPLRMKMQIQFIGRDDSSDDLQDVFTEMMIEGNRPLCNITDQCEHDSLTVAQVSKHLVSLASHDNDEVFDALIICRFSQHLRRSWRDPAS